MTGNLLSSHLIIHSKGPTLTEYTKPIWAKLQTADFEDVVPSKPEGNQTNEDWTQSHYFKTVLGHKDN